MRPFLISIAIVFSFYASALSQGPKFAEANGIKIHYLEWGSGDEVVVLLHGLGDASETWRDLAARLGGEFRIIAPDRRGSGLSARPRKGYSIEVFSDDLLALMDKAGLKKIHLAGHSYGGNIALYFAANFPDKVESLALIEGGFWEKRIPAPELPVCEGTETSDCLISNEELAAGYGFDSGKWFGKIKSRSLLLMAQPDLSRGGLSQIEEAEARAAIGKALKDAREIARGRFKKGKLSLIERSGHWPHKDQPEKLASILRKFWQKKKAS